jgi:hypothetical protein
MAKVINAADTDSFENDRIAAGFEAIAVGCSLRYPSDLEDAENICMQKTLCRNMVSSFFSSRGPHPSMCTQRKSDRTSYPPGPNQSCMLSLLTPVAPSKSPPKGTGGLIVQGLSRRWAKWQDHVKGLCQGIDAQRQTH